MQLHFSLVKQHPCFGKVLDEPKKKHRNISKKNSKKQRKKFLHRVASAPANSEWSSMISLNLSPRLSNVSFTAMY